MSLSLGGSLGGVKKIVWVKWEVVCLPKELGGLGVKNLEWFNLALLGKWGWRLLTERDSLWSCILRSKYGSFSKVVESCKVRRVWGKGLSTWWRDIVKFVGCSDWFPKGITRKVGNGLTTSFWEDKWVLEGEKLCDIFPILY